MDDFTTWLSEQDVSIQYLYTKLVKQHADTKLQKRIASEGYGSFLLSQQNPDGHWGKYYYQPKWTSTHYTLLQLKDCGISPDQPVCREIVFRMFEECQLPDGGLNLAKSNMASDICVDGMILNYASYFIPESEKLESLVASILKKQKSDGGFTWYDQSKGDPHSTICVLEGLHSFQVNAESKELQLQVERAIRGGLDYFYQHHLFLAEKKYQKLIYPFRYFYSVFRFLLLAAGLGFEANKEIGEALDLLPKKEHNGFYNLEKAYKGQTFIEFSKIGEIDPFLTVYGKSILARLR
ncbi:prenyltransferase/squalene oxidase repeat-containing protein [Enterococcus sp.]|uniref:prenyltransferase/squalene oxidase repeat-containing protein n=1 Tax=Enterococcus sp. TaxID=35783 RepID=UPI00290D5D0D|nr:prenyltransferase/squalene oxidase repeat-containing protein [Enterococcus sp.]MDU5336672.1 prenyltransferase/squalene oxidase repeat-containing protein [Enterococcus sp.]